MSYFVANPRWGKTAVGAVSLKECNSSDSFEMHPRWQTSSSRCAALHSQLQALCHPLPRECFPDATVNAIKILFLKQLYATEMGTPILLESHREDVQTLAHSEIGASPCSGSRICRLSGKDVPFREDQRGIGVGNRSCKPEGPNAKEARGSVEFIHVASKEHAR